MCIFAAKIYSLCCHRGPDTDVLGIRWCHRHCQPPDGELENVISVHGFCPSCILQQGQGISIHPFRSKRAANQYPCRPIPGDKIFDSDDEKPRRPPANYSKRNAVKNYQHNSLPTRTPWKRSHNLRPRHGRSPLLARNNDLTPPSPSQRQKRPADDEDPFGPASVKSRTPRRSAEVEMSDSPRLHPKFKLPPATPSPVRTRRSGSITRPPRSKIPTRHRIPLVREQN